MAVRQAFYMRDSDADPGTVDSFDLLAPGERNGLVVYAYMCVYIYVYIGLYMYI
jgi:hypothetical protein